MVPLAAFIVLLSGVAHAQPAPEQEVVVQAQREAIEKQANALVRKITGSAWASSNERLLGMWRIAICPLVAGLPRPQGQIIFDRLTQDASAAGAPLGAARCRPNLFVVFTTQPDALLKAWYRRDRRMFGDSMPTPVKRFLYKSLPVRIWYNTALVGQDGDMASRGAASSAGAGSAGMGGSESMGGAQASTNNVLMDLPTFQGGEGGRLGSRLGLGAVHDFSAVIAVADFKQMEGYSWRQLADYIAMMVLTNVDSDADFADTPSILALFSSAPAARPAGLTDWDSAYLNALYHTDRLSPLQRVSIVQRIVKDMDPGKPGGTVH